MRRAWASLRFALITAGQNFRRNLAVSVAGVFTMALILLMVGGTLLGTHSMNKLLDNEQAKASNLKIYLKDGLSMASVQHFESALRADPRVVSLAFESKDEAVKDNAQTNPGLNGQIAVLGSNPLPASLNVTTRQLRDLQAINDIAKQSPLVDPSQQTDYQPAVISRLQTIINWITGIGLGVSLVLAFISLVIIMNTIRTAVYVRRTEIEIMKLVGATDWFVRWPFILEGMLGGLLAAIFSGAVVFGAYRLFVQAAQGNLLSVPFDVRYTVTLLIVLLVGGVAVGAFGSFLGVRRFLSA
jgi:cell division transport system permease protein